MHKLIMFVEFSFKSFKNSFILDTVMAVMKEMIKNKKW